jgi:hypothetical protein
MTMGTMMQQLEAMGVNLSAGEAVDVFYACKDGKFAKAADYFTHMAAGLRLGQDRLVEEWEAQRRFRGYTRKFAY